MPSKDSKGSTAPQTLFVLYAAKSTKDTNDSIASQLAELREHVEEQDGKIVGEPFSEENVSGFKGSRGPELIAAQKLAAMTAAANPNADVVLLAFDSDRFARGDGKQAKHLVHYFLEAQEGGYRLDTVDPDDDLDDIVSVAVLGQRNNKDSKAKVKHIRRGMKHRAERGEFNGGPAPYGLIWTEYPVREVTNSKGEPKLVRDLLHHPPEAVIVVRIFREWAFEGVSQNGIVKALRRDGVRARNGEWQQGTVRGILTNPIYIGMNRQGQGGIVEPIIDQATWDAAQQRLEGTKRSRNRGQGRPTAGSHVYTRGLLRCGGCGGPMCPQTDRTGRETYYCHNHRDLGECDQGPVPRALIDDSTLAFFADEVLDVEATLAQLQAPEDARQAEVTAQLQEVEREQMRLAGERERIKRDYLAGNLPPQLYTELDAGNAEEQEGIAAQLEQLQARQAELSAESLVAAITADKAQVLTDMRAQVVEYIRGGGSLEAIRARLLTAFDPFVLRRLPHRVDRKAQPMTRLDAGADYIIEVFPRPEAVTGWAPAQDSGDEWWAPAVTPAAVPVPSAVGAGYASIGSPSQ